MYFPFPKLHGWGKIFAAQPKTNDSEVPYIRICGKEVFFMAKPLVAIVGRPNVGKSMLFNKLTGQRTSIVEDTPGVTRDRIYGQCEWCGRTFSLVDTGGIEPGTDSDMLKFMRRQAEIGIELADAIIMVADVRSGVTAADQDVATMLRKSGKPVALAVNKCDSIGLVNPDAFEFYSLGIGGYFFLRLFSLFPFAFFHQAADHFRNLISFCSQAFYFLFDLSVLLIQLDHLIYKGQFAVLELVPDILFHDFRIFS